jgi:hypothetical protein
MVFMDNQTNFYNSSAVVTVPQDMIHTKKAFWTTFITLIVLMSLSLVVTSVMGGGQIDVSMLLYVPFVVIPALIVAMAVHNKYVLPSFMVTLLTIGAIWGISEFLNRMRIGEGGMVFAFIFMGLFINVVCAFVAGIVARVLCKILLEKIKIPPLIIILPVYYAVTAGLGAYVLPTLQLVVGWFK